MQSDKLVLELPTSWNKVTVQQYNDITGILTSTVLKDEVKYMHIISILSGEPFETIEKLDVIDFQKILKNLGWLSDEVTPNEKFNPHFKLNGVDYFINLEPTKLTAAEYVDILYLAKVDNILLEVPKILARFIKPVKVTKNIFGKKSFEVLPFETEDLEMELEDMYIRDAIAVFNFFLKTLKTLIESTLNSLELQMKKYRMRMKVQRSLKLKPSQKVLDGLETSLKLHQQLTDLYKMFMR